MFESNRVVIRVYNNNSMYIYIYIYTSGGIILFGTNRDYFWLRREDHIKEKKPVECKESRMDEPRVWIAGGIYGASG